MSELVAIAKVARVLGLNRAELRRRIEDAGIATFEGMVEVAALPPIAPTFGLAESDILEKTRLIRENAKALRHDPSVVQPKDLSRQVRTLTMDLLLEKQRVHRYKGLFDDLCLRLDGLLASPEATHRDLALDLNKWLADRLSQS